MRPPGSVDDGVRERRDRGVHLAARVHQLRESRDGAARGGARRRSAFARSSAPSRLAAWSRSFSGSPSLLAALAARARARARRARAARVRRVHAARASRSTIAASPDMLAAVVGRDDARGIGGRELSRLLPRRVRAGAACSKATRRAARRCRGSAQEALVGFQFAISIALVIATAVVYRADRLHARHRSRLRQGADRRRERWRNRPARGALGGVEARVARRPRNRRRDRVERRARRSTARRRFLARRGCRSGLSRRST